MTAVINKLMRILSLKGCGGPDRDCPKTIEKPVVFVTHMEHHSNHTSWFETTADVVQLEPGDDMLVDLDDLKSKLEIYKDREFKIGTFTACSNVTGVKTPYHQMAKLMHEYGGVVFIDFAASAPYMEMNMHPEDPMEKLDAIFARWAGSAYQRFIGVVASGRDKEPDYIRSIAGGRVWLAEAAQERGLVDDIGSIDQALEAAAEMAGLEAYRVDYVTPQPSRAAQLLQRFAIGALGVDGDLREHSFARRLARLMEELEGISEPQATVLCAHCMIDLP